MTKCNVEVPIEPLRSHIVGEYIGQTVDCKQYANDYDILYHFPFRIMINPMLHYWDSNIATMDNTNTFVSSLTLIDTGSIIPESIFCLKKLDQLTIINMNFANGIIPDTLANLQQLYKIDIYNSSITNLTDQFASLTRLYSLHLNNCSLSQISSLSNMPDLRHIYLENNRLSKIDGFRSDVDCLHISDNLFTEIPTFTTPTSLAILRMNNNPLKNVRTLDSFTNLAFLELRNTTLSFIPTTIDKLQRLAHVDLSHNKLTYLPRSIFKLKSLQYLYINNNTFSFNEIKSIQMEFSKTHPNITLRI